MRRLLVIALVWLTLTAQDESPMPAPTSVDFGPTVTCAQNLKVIPGLFEAITSDKARQAIEDDRQIRVMRNEPPSVSALVLGNEEVEQTLLGATATCPVGPNRDLLRAFAASLRGFVKYYKGGDGWRDDLNLSDQLLAACVKANSGTALGARCATGIETNGRWRRAWGS
jgi:hypothetical protein